MDAYIPKFPKPSHVKQSKPERIERRDGTWYCNDDSAAGKSLYKRLTLFMAKRQKWRCAMCGRKMEYPTFDHELGRGFNGSHRNDAPYIRDERGRLRRHNAAVDGDCNSSKGSRRIEYRFQ